MASLKVRTAVAMRAAGELAGCAPSTGSQLPPSAPSSLRPCFASRNFSLLSGCCSQEQAFIYRVYTLLTSVLGLPWLLRLCSANGDFSLLMR